MDNSFDEQLRYERAKKKVRSIRGFFVHLTVYVLVNLFLLTLKWVNLEPNEAFFTFGTFSTAFFWGFGLVFHGISVFGATLFLGNNWEDRKIKEMMGQEDHNKKKWE